MSVCSWDDWSVVVRVHAFENHILSQNNTADDESQVSSEVNKKTSEKRPLSYNLPNGTFRSLGTMYPALRIGIINSNATKPVIAGIITGPFKIRRRSNGDIRWNERGACCLGLFSGLRLIYCRVESGYIRIIQIFTKIVSTAGSTITRRVFETGLTARETDAFFRFARAAVLSG